MDIAVSFGRVTSRRAPASGANATTRLIGTSFLAGLLLTAAQLGLGSGLGLLDWHTPGGYGSALAWVAFIFTAATLGGVFVARRRVAGARAALGARPGLAARSGALRVVLRRAGVAIASGTGALVALPLVWLPVRAGVAGVDNPAGTVIGSAVGAVAMGVVFALAALAAGPVAAGLAASALWLWVAALASVTLAVVEGGPAGARLGVIEAPTAPSDWWSGPYPMIGLYATLALTVALTASRLGAPRRQIALSGLVGPALLASAYAVAGSGAAGTGAAGTGAGSAVAGGPTIGGSAKDAAAAVDAASAIAGGDVRVAALVAAGVGLLASTLIAMRGPRPALSAARTALTTTLVDETAVTVAQAPLAPAPAPPPAPAPARAPASSPARAKSAARRAGTLDETARPTKRSKSRSTATAKPAAHDAAPTAQGTTGIPAPRGPAERKATGRKRAARAQPEVAVPAEVRLPVDDNVRMSRREREHVKWMENLLNTPPDPTLTTRRRSS